MSENVYYTASVSFYPKLWLHPTVEDASIAFVHERWSVLSIVSFPQQTFFFIFLLITL